MNDTAKVLKWECLELTKVQCDDEEVNKAADEFIGATVEFCESIRNSVDWFDLGVLVINENGEIADDNERAEILDDYLRYTLTEEKLTIWLCETNIRNAIDSQDFENGIAIPISSEGTSDISMNPIHDYLENLGILDKVLALDCGICYRNAIDTAYYILSDKLNSVINLRSAMSDDHDSDAEICATIKLNNGGKSVSDFEMTDDISILEKNPEKKWFLNVSGVIIAMAFKQDEIKATQQEYEEAAKEYLGERMLTVFEQHPEGVSVLWDCNGLCVSGRELIEKVELIRNSIKFNMLMMKTDNWQDLGADYLPYAELEDDETITYIGEIVAVSEDMEMVRIPLI